MLRTSLNALTRIPVATRRALGSLCGALATLQPTRALADAAVRVSDGESAAMALGRVGLALAVVLLAFWAFAALLRRVQRPMTGGGRNLRVLAALSVGPRERVLLLQIGEEQIVVGSGAQGLRTLHVLGKPIEPDDNRPEAGFKRQLKASMRSENIA